jgi:nucleotide-binding universal stress UspA family protein
MKILLAYNNRSTSSDKALEVARLHARAFQASIDVITSADPTKSEKDLPQKEEAERALWQVEESFRDAGIPCRTHFLIRGYAPGEDIVRFARENEIDEIIIGVERKSRVGKLLMGSVAQLVILKAPCPVVTVKATDEEADVFLGATSMYEED